MKVRIIAAVAALVASGIVHAQSPQYGHNISLEQARKAMAAAEGEARKNNWPVAIAITDTAGMLVLYQRLDNTQSGSFQVAIDKAVSAAMFRRPTKAFEDVVGGGGVGVSRLALRNASPIDGGVPVLIEGKIVGGIGVSGVAGNQDAMVAKAGADAVK